MAHIGQAHFTGALYCFLISRLGMTWVPLQSFAARTLQSPFCVQGLQQCTTTFYALRPDGPWGLGARHRDVPYKEKKDQIGPNLVSKWHQTWEYRGVWSTFDVRKKCSRRLFGREFIRRPRTTAWRCVRVKDAKNMPRSTVPASLVTRTVSDAVPHTQEGRFRESLSVKMKYRCAILLEKQGIFLHIEFSAPHGSSVFALSCGIFHDFSFWSRWSSRTHCLYPHFNVHTWCFRTLGASEIKMASKSPKRS